MQAGYLKKQNKKNQIKRKDTGDRGKVKIMKKISFEEFQQEALKGNGVQNDAANVWVYVDGKQYTVDISDVLDHEESEPFEASYSLESDLYADAWEELYRQYLGE